MRFGSVLAAAMLAAACAPCRAALQDEIQVHDRYTRTVELGWYVPMLIRPDGQPQVAGIMLRHHRPVAARPMRGAARFM